MKLLFLLKKKNGFGRRKVESGTYLTIKNLSFEFLSRLATSLLL